MTDDYVPPNLTLDQLRKRVAHLEERVGRAEGIIHDLGFEHDHLLGGPTKKTWDRARAHMQWGFDHDLRPEDFE
jgi:hypothetical protein